MTDWVIYPEQGLPPTDDGRPFNHDGKEGEWYKAEDWR